MEHRTADIDLWCRVTFREIRNQALNSLDGHRTQTSEHLVGDVTDLFVSLSVVAIPTKVETR
jgi:hypothetical protein